jgi:hypothetical protein
MFRHVEQRRHSSRRDRRHETRRVTDLLKTGRLRALALASTTPLDDPGQANEAPTPKRRVQKFDPESD